MRYIFKRGQEKACCFWSFARRSLITSYRYLANGLFCLGVSNLPWQRIQGHWPPHATRRYSRHTTEEFDSDSEPSGLGRSVDVRRELAVGACHFAWLAVPHDDLALASPLVARIVPLIECRLVSYGPPALGWSRLPFGALPETSIVGKICVVLMYFGADLYISTISCFVSGGLYIGSLLEINVL